MEAFREMIREPCVPRPIKTLLYIGDIDTFFAHGERLSYNHQDTQEGGHRVICEQLVPAENIGGPVADYGSLHSMSIGSLIL